jgi:hypothetical protein
VTSENKHVLCNIAHCTAQENTQNVNLLPRSLIINVSDVILDSVFYLAAAALSEPFGLSALCDTE